MLCVCLVSGRDKDTAKRTMPSADPGATHATALRVYPRGQPPVVGGGGGVGGPCRAASPSSIRTHIQWILGCVSVLLVLSMLLEWRESAALLRGDQRGPGSTFAPYTTLHHQQQDTKTTPTKVSERVLVSKALPAFMYEDRPVPGLSLFGAYWKGAGNMVVFSGQCFDQHHTPDYCALYLQSNTSLCTMEGSTRQAAGGILECFLHDPHYDCPLAVRGCEVSGVMAVVGRRDEQTAHTIPLADYRPHAVGEGSKHEVSVCSIFKAQSSDPQLGVQRFLEWIEYHTLIGVQHFYLYDHGSDADKMDALRPLFGYYEAKGVLTLRHVHFSNKCGIGLTGVESTHEWAYSDCSARYRGLDDWMAFLDNDEYIYPGDGYESVGGYVQEVIEGPGRGNVVALNMVWTPFASSGHDRRPPGLVIDNYIKAEKPRCYSGENSWDVYCTGKMLGRLETMGYLSFPHLVDYDSSHGLHGLNTRPEWWSDPAALMTSQDERQRDRLLFNRPEPSNAYCHSKQVKAKTRTTQQQGEGGEAVVVNVKGSEKEEEKEGRPLCMWTPDPATGPTVFHYYTQDWGEKMDRGCVIGCLYTWDMMIDHDKRASNDETRMRDRFGGRVREAMAAVNQLLTQAQAPPQAMRLRH